MAVAVEGRTLPTMDRMLRWSRTHPMAIDAFLAAAVLLLGFAGRDESSMTLRVPFELGFALPLVWRRVAPRWTFVALAGVGLAQYVAGVGPNPGNLALLISLYSVAVQCGRRDTVVAAAVVTFGNLLAILRWGHEPLASFAFLSALTLAAVLSGETIRVRRAYLGALEARAAQLERERDQQAVIAVAAERSRIARELHDIVAHHVSVMIAQADGASYAIDGDPTRARDAIAIIAQTGRAALSEMRHIVGVLRPSDFSEGTEPQPSADRIEELVERLTETGYAVTLSVQGTPAPIPAGPGLAAYRIVQESLTNTFKHAGPDARAQVTVTYGDGTIRVRIDDHGRSDGRATNGAGATTGHGLVGMHERVAMYDGSFHSGHRPDGGYSVDAELDTSVETS